MPHETERQVEDYLRQECIRQGWMCEKFTSPNRRSVPDRIITMPGGRIVFVECKASKGKLTSGQQRDHERRSKFGCEVYVIYSRVEVDVLIGMFEKGGRNETVT